MFWLADYLRNSECMKTQSCAPIKHHYDECVERVTSQMEENDGKSKENCVEECNVHPHPVPLYETDTELT